MSKTTQLRVRLGDSYREQLLGVAAERGRGETLSDIVREAIETYLAPTGCAETNKVHFQISAKSAESVERLAQELKRKPAQVVEDCVDGVLDAYENARMPLIIMELNLRRQYHSEAESRKSALEFPISVPR